MRNIFILRQLRICIINLFAIIFWVYEFKFIVELNSEHSVEHTKLFWLCVTWIIDLFIVFLPDVCLRLDSVGQLYPTALWTSSKVLPHVCCSREENNEVYTVGSFQTHC